MNAPGRYYEHSGAVTPLGVVLALSSGVIAAACLGAIYAYASFYIPFIYFNAILTVVFGAAVGYGVFLGARLGKLRNPGLALTLGLCAGLFAGYAQWVVWIFAATEQDGLLLSPIEVWDALNRISVSGAWSVFGLTPSGFALWAVWLVEAVIIAGSAGAVSWSRLNAQPFCERCGQWAGQRETLPPFEHLARPDEFKQQIDAGNASIFKTLNAATADVVEYTEVALSNCGRCHQMPLAGVELVTLSVDAKGKKTKTSKPLIENLISDSATHEMLRHAVS